jgi:excisionase family DNA binding protein
MMTKELLTADEAAKLLKIARRTLLRWARDRKIESVRVSRKVVLFTAEAIDRFLSAKTVRVESESPIRPRPGTRSDERQMNHSGTKRSSGQSWQDLRKEVLSWTKPQKK